MTATYCPAMTKQELARMIADVSLLHGDFTLRSGRKSSYYLDKYLFETQPRILRELGRMLAEKVTPDIDRIAGAELGAVALAAATAMACDKPFVIVRNRKKDYGTSKALEGTLKAGENVLLVEDVLTTGGQVLEAAQTIRDAQANVSCIVAVIDRQEGAKENIEAAGYRLESLFTSTDLGIK